MESSHMSWWTALWILVRYEWLAAMASIPSNFLRKLSEFSDWGDNALERLYIFLRLLAIIACRVTSLVTSGPCLRSWLGLGKIWSEWIDLDFHEATGSIKNDSLQRFEVRNASILISEILLF
jgi:hypothetical protein